MSSYMSNKRVMRRRHYLVTGRADASAEIHPLPPGLGAAQLCWCLPCLAFNRSRKSVKAVYRREPILCSMKGNRKTMQWTALSLVSMLVLGWSIFFAPGHRHAFGNWNDPFSVLMGIAVVVALVGNSVALCLMARRGSL
jgi:hypothetical protein